MSGNGFIDYSDEVFQSEKDTAHHNQALVKLLSDNECFPEDTNMEECLHLYFKVKRDELKIVSKNMISPLIFPVLLHSFLEPSIQ